MIFVSPCCRRTGPLKALFDAYRYNMLDSYLREAWRLRVVFSRIGGGVYAAWAVLVVFALLPAPRACGLVLFEETFEDDVAGMMPIPGPASWQLVNWGAGCTNVVVSAAASPIGTGQAVHLVDKSAEAPVSLKKWSGITPQTVVHLSFQFFETAAATTPFTVALGGPLAETSFARLEIGGGNVVAKQGNGTADVGPVGAEYAKGATVSIDIVVNAGAAAANYTTWNSLNGTAGGGRYDVYVNGTIVLHDADWADYSGAIYSLSFYTSDPDADSDVYLDNIRLDALNTTPTSGSFSLTVIPESQDAFLCGEIEYRMIAVPEGNFNGYVGFGVDPPVPAGLLFYFNPPTAGPPGWLSVATIWIPPTLTQGQAYPLTFKGTVGTRTVQKTATFVIRDAPLPQYSLTLSTNGYGEVATDPPTGPYPCGTVVRLTATPADGYRVASWTGTDNDASKAGTNTVTMRSNKSVRVTFEPAALRKYQLTASVDGGYGTISPTSGTYDSGTVVELNARPDVGYRVKTWTGTDSDSSTSHLNRVTMNSDKTVTVSFEAVPEGFYQLTADVVGGHGTVQPTDGTYAATTPPTQVELLARPEAGYRVKAWHGTDDDSRTTETNSITMNGHKFVSVEFESASYTLTVDVIGGHGTVTPSGGTYAKDTVVHLIAAPDDGYQVKSWKNTDDDASLSHLNTVTMTADVTVEIEFEPVPAGYHRLLAHVIGGHGTVSPTDRTYVENETAIVEAFPDANYQVKAWTGTDDDTRKTPTVTVLMDRDRTVTVEFELIDCNRNGTADATDIANGSSRDCNGNGVPDECDPNPDGDGVPDECDNCPTVANADQANADGDAAGDACDGCPNDPASTAPCAFPADTDGSNSISIREVVRYNAAWLNRTAWPTAPTTIPPSYADRATLLWRSGEAYQYVNGYAVPEGWQPLAQARQWAAAFIRDLLDETVEALLSQPMMPPDAGRAGL